MAKVPAQEKLRGDVAIGNGLIPDDDGPRCLPFTDTIVSGEPYIIDLTLVALFNFIRSIQSVWIDNSAGTQPIYVTAEGTRQRLKVAAGDAKFLPILLQPHNAKVTVERASSGEFQIIFVNVPVPTSVGGADFASITTQLAALIALETPPGTGTATSVAAVTNNVTLRAANASNKGTCLVNDSASAVLKVALGFTATTTTFSFSLQPGEEANVAAFTGPINGIWSAAVGNARITELT